MMRYLCIGGPEDGRWWDMGERREFEAAVLPREPIRPMQERHMVIETVRYRRVRYILVEIRLADPEYVAFWKPEDMPTSAAFALLLASYQASAPVPED